MTEQRLLPHVVVNTQDVKLLFLLWSNCLQPVGSVGAVNPCLESFYTVNMAYICMAASECNTSSRRNWTWWPGLLSVPLFPVFFFGCTSGNAQTRGKLPPAVTLRVLLFPAATLMTCRDCYFVTSFALMSRARVAALCSSAAAGGFLRDSHAPSSGQKQNCSIIAACFSPSSD